MEKDADYYQKSFWLALSTKILHHKIRVQRSTL